MTDDHKHAKTNTDFRYATKYPRRALCYCVTILFLLVGITVLTLWLVYRPQKPNFTVVSVTVLKLSTTSTLPPSVSAAMQFTIVTKNPNVRVSILYDRLSAFVSYRNQMITQPIVLPPLFHEKRSSVEMSPLLGGGGACCTGGGAVPVAPEVAYELGMDEEYGVVGLRLVLLGKIRWKAATLTTVRYGIYIKCDVLVRLSKGFVGEVPFVAPPLCIVDV